MATITLTNTKDGEERTIPVGGEVAIFIEMQAGAINRLQAALRKVLTESVYRNRAALAYECSLSYDDYDTFCDLVGVD